MPRDDPRQRSNLNRQWGSLLRPHALGARSGTGSTSSLVKDTQRCLSMTSCCKRGERRYVHDKPLPDGG
jgi:hypothetical protein